MFPQSSGTQTLSAALAARPKNPPAKTKNQKILRLRSLHPSNRDTGACCGPRISRAGEGACEPLPALRMVEFMGRWHTLVFICHSGHEECGYRSSH